MTLTIVLTSYVTGVIVLGVFHILLDLIGVMQHEDNYDIFMSVVFLLAWPVLLTVLAFYSVSFYIKGRDN